MANRPAKDDAIIVYDKIRRESSRLMRQRSSADMETGKIRNMKPLRQIPLPEPRWTPDQEQTAFEPYDDKRTWARLLIAEMMAFAALGTPRRLMGPVALRERVERRFGCTTASATTSAPST